MYNFQTSFVFATHGLPEQIVSDNGSGFISSEFQKLFTDNGVRQCLSSPYHPPSNGLAERAVQTFKNAVSKLEGPMEVRILKFLFKYSATPQTTTGLSPAQLLTGRRLRTHLDLLHPDTSNRVIDKQEKSISTNKAPRTFKIGDKLFAKNFHGTQWIPVVVCKVSGPLSYHVKTEDKIVLPRHVDHLRIRYSDNPEQPEWNEESDDWILMPRQDAPNPHTQSNSNITSRSTTTNQPTPTPKPVRHSTRTRAPVDRYSLSQ